MNDKTVKLHTRSLTRIMSFCLKLHCLAFIIFLTADRLCAQRIDSVIALKAYRRGKTIDPVTGEMKGFSLCGSDLTVDTLGFFSMIFGCERNVYGYVARYIYKHDTITLSAFDFIKEDAFVKIYRKKANTPVQKIQFLAIGGQPLKGRDSSWVVRCFKGRREQLLDFSENGVVAIKRGQFDGLELLQLSKIFGSPIVMFPDADFDYLVVVNMPLELLTHFIHGGGTGDGRFIIKQGELHPQNSHGPDDNFKIHAGPRRYSSN